MHGSGAEHECWPGAKGYRCLPPAAEAAGNGAAPAVAAAPPSPAARCDAWIASSAHAGSLQYTKDTRRHALAACGCGGEYGQCLAQGVNRTDGWENRTDAARCGCACGEREAACPAGYTKCNGGWCDINADCFLDNWCPHHHDADGCPADRTGGCCVTAWRCPAAGGDPSTTSSHRYKLPDGTEVVRHVSRDATRPWCAAATAVVRAGAGTGPWEDTGAADYESCDEACEDAKRHEHYSKHDDEHDAHDDAKKHKHDWTSDEGTYYIKLLCAAGGPPKYGDASVRVGFADC